MKSVFPMYDNGVQCTAAVDTAVVAATNANADVVAAFVGVFGVAVVIAAVAAIVVFLLLLLLLLSLSLWLPIAG